MLYLGKSLLGAEDIHVLRALVSGCHSRHGRPLVGLEMGPWLGRSTLAHLAPHLPIGNMNPMDALFYELNTTDLHDLEAVWISINRVFEQFQVDNVELAKGMLLETFAHLVNDNKHVYERLYCVDTWQGIVSEANQSFQEADSDDPHRIFSENIHRAGFGDVVETLCANSWEAAAKLNGTMDTIFLDADHELLSVVKDLFSIRHLLREDTVLYGHDINHTDRWPGVEIGVKEFVRHYRVEENLWIAEPEGIAHLLSLPPYEVFQQDVEALQAEHNRRYEDVQYQRKFGLKNVA